MVRLLLNQWNEIARMAVRDLIRKKTRSFLTALGVIFGIASVVSMVSIGDGAQNQILDQIQGMGLNNIVIKSIKPQVEVKSNKSNSWIKSYGLTLNDIERIRNTIPTIERLSIIKNHSGRAWNAGAKESVELRGVDQHFFKTTNLTLTKGRIFDTQDNEHSKNICIISENLLKKLHFPIKINQDVRINTEYYTVVGIYKDSDLPSALVSDFGPTVLIPLKSAFKRLGAIDFRVSQGDFDAVKNEISEIICKVKNNEDVIKTSEWLDIILKREHPAMDYTLIIPLQLLKQKQQTQQIFNIVMVLIATISLIVGGIGIINIMLATVTERTKEIGIRRAIGATKQDIVNQFLMETVVLTISAGMIGCLLGLVVIQIIEKTTGWTAVIHIGLFGWAFAISCLVGILFGIYPALKAAELDPIESLRYE